MAKWLLALYLATGTVAAIAGYLRHNTAAKQYAVTLRTRASAAKVAASSAADLALARQTMVALEEERRRRAEGWVKAQEEWQAIARRLKQEARLRLASAAQNPSTTDAYFVPPTSTGLPVSGAPVSGMPISGMPISGMPISGTPYPTSSGTVVARPVAPPPHQDGRVYQTADPYEPPSTYHGHAAVPAPPAAIDPPAPRRLNANSGAQRPSVDNGSAADQVRWDGGR